MGKEAAAALLVLARRAQGVVARRLAQVRAVPLRQGQQRGQLRARGARSVVALGSGRRRRVARASTPWAAQGAQGAQGRAEARECAGSRRVHLAHRLAGAALE